MAASSSIRSSGRGSITRSTLTTQSRSSVAPLPLPRFTSSTARSGFTRTRPTLKTSELSIFPARISARSVLTAHYLRSIPAPGHKYLDDPRWKAWVASIEKAGMVPTRCALGSAHQMGSCQMGTKSSTSVVDPRGRVWGTKGLYIADASIFPTASGVNPMITVRSAFACCLSAVLADVVAIAEHVQLALDRPLHRRGCEGGACGAHPGAALIHELPRAYHFFLLPGFCSLYSTSAVVTPGADHCAFGVYYEQIIKRYKRGGFDMYSITTSELGGWKRARRFS